MSPAKRASELTAQGAAAQAEMDLLVRQVSDERMKFWAAKEAWSPEQAVCLAFGIEPRDGFLSWAQKHWPYLSLAQQAADMHDKMVHTPGMRGTVASQRFVIWATSEDWCVDARFRALGEVLGRDRASREIEALEASIKRIKGERAAYPESDKVLLLRLIANAVDFAWPAMPVTRVYKCAGVPGDERTFVKYVGLGRAYRSGDTPIPDAETGAALATGGAVTEHLTWEQRALAALKAQLKALEDRDRIRHPSALMCEVLAALFGAHWANGKADPVQRMTRDIAPADGGLTAKQLTQILLKGGAGASLG